MNKKPTRDDTPMWHLNLSGSFHLADPDGKEVRLPTWKTEALLTMLVSAGTKGVSKEAITNRLWPGQGSAKAAANLRQTVRRLRTAIGSDSVLSAWDTFRLSDGFGIRADTGSEDDHLRPERRIATLGSPIVQSPTSALLQVVNWALDFDPPRAVDLLRSNHDIALEFSPVDVRPLADRLLGAFKPSDPQFGWALYFLGNAQFQSATFSEVERTFTSAMSHGREFGDDQLVSMCVVFLCASSLCRGQVRLAKAAVTRMSAIADRGYSVHLPRHIAGSQASLHLQEGNLAAAFGLMRDAIDLTSDWPKDQAHLRAQYALCLATVGQVPAAVDILDDLRRFSQVADFQRLNFHIDLAQQMVLLKEGEFVALRAMSLPLIRHASASGSAQTELHAREILAAGSWSAGDHGMAERDWKAALSLRRKLRIAPTEWDRARLKDLPLAAALFPSP